MHFDSVRIDRSRPPLRWLANALGEIASWTILKAAYLDEDQNWGFKYNLYSTIYSKTMPFYQKYGTFYKLDLDLSGVNWDDYDENGIPYWDKWENWDFEDEFTGDAFRIIK